MSKFLEAYRLRDRSAVPTLSAVLVLQRLRAGEREQLLRKRRSRARAAGAVVALVLAFALTLACAGGFLVNP